MTDPRDEDEQAAQELREFLEQHAKDAQEAEEEAQSRERLNPLARAWQWLRGPNDEG